MNVDVNEYNLNKVMIQSKTCDISIFIDGKVTRNLLFSRITKPGIDAFWSPGVDPFKSVFKFEPVRPFSPPGLDPPFIKEPFIVTDVFENIELESGKFKEEDFEFLKVI
ncbi:hypothetical protein [Oceanirhabdus seepicola]|uniref:Uncharacterized protein n=1 Tax=Oceanirhabdus seepicola TaxID=2828781 RepID=A0A9J6NZG7_9CLOT|nr:hypothetical protein [Oceanirhabdus seepicola]MCM1988536.1 hypothetical protein [Oceanirhabdus seepicola]